MPAYDFALIHGWGGAYVCPKTDAARQWCSNNLHHAGAVGWLANMDADGDYVIDHRDALDVAQAIKAAGLTFPQMEELK